MSDKTKYVILVGDGMVDRPGDFAEGRTPLAEADIPSMDIIAACGTAGLVRTIPPGMDPGSDVANMALMGYNPGKYYTGRAPLEAVSMGIELAPNQVAFRCNLVNIQPGPGGVLDPGSVMGSHSAGHITSPEAREIIDDLERELGGEGRRFHAGVSYRHLLVVDGAPVGTVLTPPHDITGQVIGNRLPRGEGADELLVIMEKAAAILADHPVNRRRLKAGEEPANSVWFWGQGKKPDMPTLKESYGLTGSVISAVDLVKGLGKVAGLEVVEVPGATGYIDTNYRGKARAALDALDRGDLAFVHVEAPDEAGHQGDFRMKVRAIEDFDAKVVAPILEGIGKHPSWAIMVVADHSTPLSIRTHSSEPVIYAIFRSSDSMGRAGVGSCTEVSLAGEDVLPDGEALLKRFLGVG